MAHDISLSLETSDEGFSDGVVIFDQQDIHRLRVARRGGEHAPPRFNAIGFSPLDE